MPAGRPRKRTPEENKRLGNPGKRKVSHIPDHPDMSKLTEDVPEPPIKPARGPRKPAWLKGTASEVWDDLLEGLGDSELLHMIDSNLLLEYCSWTGIARDAQEELAKAASEGTPLARLTAGDQTHPHPAIKRAKDAWKQSRDAYKALGLAPGDRKKAGIKLDGGTGSKNSSGLERGNETPNNGPPLGEPELLLTAEEQWILGLREDC